MNFMSLPTLEHITLVSVASSLWNQHDVRTLITKFTNSELFPKLDNNLYIGEHVRTKRNERWQRIEKKVIEKVPLLRMTRILEKKTITYIQPVGFQILKWMEYHCKCLRFKLVLPNQLFWTPQGTLDNKKMAEVLIKDDSIDIATRYKLACVYCLENDVPKIWNELPENIQKSVLIEGNIGDNIQTDFLIFWKMYFKGEIVELGRMIRRIKNLRCSAYRFMFGRAAQIGNKAATQYFFQKLFPRKESLLRTAIYVSKIRRVTYPSITLPPADYYSEVLCFLMSQMNDNQQIKLLKKKPLPVLDSLLIWPWQNFFVNTANRLWNFFPAKNYFNLVSPIIHKGIFRYRDFNYQKMFRELWQQTPISFKKYVMHDCIAGLLHLLLQVKDRESLKLVIQDAALSEIKEFFFTKKGFDLCTDCNRDLHLLKFFIQLFISSSDEMIRFKKEYENYLDKKPKLKSKIKVLYIDVNGGLRSDDFEHRITQIVKLLDELIHNYGKRKTVDEGDDSTSKRLCKVGLMDMTQIKKEQQLNTGWP